ncbi:MAG: MBL fold metallo-hydrolase [Phycisphaerales bacterium]|nr:MBL fold metallo-hydrolase [Phycisphaerales bacterium]
MTQPLRVRTLTLGPFQTNCYIVSEEGSADCFVIDASFGGEAIVEAIRREKLNPVALVFTHAHIDHIAGAHAVKRAFPDMPLWIHAQETQWLVDPELNLSAAAGMPITAPVHDRALVEGDSLDMPGGPWQVFHTPGHSPGSITLYSATHAVAFVGDALFAGSIGRTDFPGCSLEELEQSIRGKIYPLPPKTRCFPGHGPATSVERERASNPFVRG